MKDEIKEILDNTLEYLEGIDETRNTKILTTNETNILLDYITNLQSKIDKIITLTEPFINQKESVINGKVLERIYDIAKGE